MTHMSAIARTEPGGYTGVGTATAHLTVRGNVVDLPEEKKGQCKATEQFEISDQRSPEQVVCAIRGADWNPSGRIGIQGWTWSNSRIFKAVCRAFLPSGRGGMLCPRPDDSLAVLML